ncbi:MULTISPECIES: hypothetical protein [Nostoc]|uniref:Uncharacterized protein n=2 Tax=Nostoc TaxID=1177 RepID=A0ABR8IIU4_9NOSO|nr:MULTISPECIES: hypothetical protein [Nostoc]MBD2565142.1 hypothetical protein [Nostoc linckia FACHB-391]MBD2650777.1 hypothetical protein [Nostoc foliaceum FACHB-393]
MKGNRIMLALSCMIVITLNLMSCAEKVKVESRIINTGTKISGSASLYLSTAKKGAEAECEQIYNLATNASSDAQILSLLLVNSEMNPHIDQKIGEIKQHLDRLQSATIKNVTVVSLRSEYVSMMQEALQSVEAWSASKAETQRQQITKVFSTQISKAISFRMKRMFIGNCQR